MTSNKLLEAKVKNLLRHSIAAANYMNLNLCDRGAVHSANVLESTKKWGPNNDVTHLASIGIDLSESNTRLDFVGRIERWAIDVNPCISFGPII